MTYLSPPRFPLGAEEAALLRGFKEGGAAQAFVEARIAEIRELLNTPYWRGPRRSPSPRRQVRCGSLPLLERWSAGALERWSAGALERLGCRGRSAE
ncbi:hypothetical protein [Streptomyces spinosirectus]